jgi:hypothetical protein
MTGGRIGLPQRESSDRRLSASGHLDRRAQAEFVSSLRADMPREIRVEALPAADLSTSALYTLTRTYAGESDRSKREEDY